MRIHHTTIRLWSARLCQPRITYNDHAYRRLTQSSANHYEVLGLKSTASQSQIKSAYYQLSKKYHPDVAVDVNNAKEKFTRLSTAYEVLGNPDKREEYDRTLYPSMGRSATYTPPGSDIDIEYREFLRRRGSFHTRTGGHAPPGTAGRARFNYEEFFKQQHQQYGQTMRQNWEAQKNFEHRMRQKQAAIMQAFWFFFVLTLGLSLGARSS